MTPKDPSDAFLTRAEMANALGKSKTTIRQWEESEVAVLCALVKDRSALVELDRVALSRRRAARRDRRTRRRRHPRGLQVHAAVGACGTLRRLMSLPICAACSAELPTDLVTLEPRAADSERCFRCDQSAAHDVVILRLPQDAIDGLRVDIGACENESIDITSGILGDVLPDRVPDDTVFGEVLLRLVEGHDFDVIEWPDFACHGCGAELENWWTDVRTGTFVQVRRPTPRSTSGDHEAAHASTGRENRMVAIGRVALLGPPDAR